MTRRIQSTTHDDAISIYEELQKIVQKKENGMCEYTNGEDDHAVAKRMGFAPSSVASIRLKRFGRLIERAEHIAQQQVEEALKAFTADMLARVADAHSASLARYDDLLKRHNELQKKHDLLCTALAANRLADVKHLRIGDPFQPPGQRSQ
jgi:hypothetical protein